MFLGLGPGRLAKSLVHVVWLVFLESSHRYLEQVKGDYQSYLRWFLDEEDNTYSDQSLKEHFKHGFIDDAISYDVAIVPEQRSSWVRRVSVTFGTRLRRRLIEEWRRWGTSRALKEIFHSWDHVLTEASLVLFFHEFLFLPSFQSHLPEVSNEQSDEYVEKDNDYYDRKDTEYKRS